MADAGRVTFQSNIKTHTDDNIDNYAFFLGGLNVTRDALKQYDPLKTGFGRIFMVRQPKFVMEMLPEKLRKFKHVLEYANIGVEGLQNITLDSNPLTGGYTNRQMDVPNIAKDDQTSFTIKTYEFSGSLMREVIQYWINGIADIQSGLSHYNGAKVPVCQANQSAEFIYVVTDQTGTNVEYACMFANCVPREIKLDQFNYSAGDHNLVQMDIEFTCTRYMSPQINNLAQALLVKYGILMNSLNFHSGMTTAEVIDKTGTGSTYDMSSGTLTRDNSVTSGNITGVEAQRIATQYNGTQVDSSRLNLNGRASYETMAGAGGNGNPTNSEFNV